MVDFKWGAGAPLDPVLLIELDLFQIFLVFFPLYDMDFK